MTGYRICSAVQAGAYLCLTASIYLAPPPDSRGTATVLETVAGPGLWCVFFVAASLFMLWACAFRPLAVFLGHVFLLPIVAAYGVANLGTSIINDTGWQVFALCLALAAGHVLAIRRRPFSRPGPGPRQ